MSDHLDERRPRPAKAIFITGTGTDVGKTTAAGALARGLGANVTYWKPVQSGEPRDSETFASLCPGEQRIAPAVASYALAASPDQAAAAQGRVGARVSDLQRTYAELNAENEGRWLLVEGAGGLYVPLNDAAETWLDFIDGSELACLVIASSGLGTLNHTVLTVRALRERGATVLGVVLSGERHRANEQSLGRLLPGLAIHALEPLVAGKTERQDRELAAFVTRAYEARQPRQRDILTLDKRHVWHPYTQHLTAPAPLVARRAKGAWLELADGRRLIDGSSSWWVNNIGHGRPEIGAAIAAQQAKLDHVIFAGMTHEAAVQVAARVTTATGPKLSRAFFSDNGSTAVEVALKMVYQSWVNQGEKQRTRFLAFAGSYHGDTFGAMSVASTEGFFSAFKPLLFKTLWAAPATSHRSHVCPDGEAALSQRLAELRILLDREHSSLAGVIIEPLVQGAAGMLVQPSAWLREVAALCRAYRLPLIFDEVFTGFGRVGALFAFQRAGVEPDVLCLAKGLTGGTLPLSLTVASEELFSAFLDDDKARALLHGHSFTANPIACAASLAALDIIEREDLPARARRLEGRYLEWLASEGHRLGVENGRALGAILAFELPGSGFGDYFAPSAAKVAASAIDAGLFIRPLGNTIYFTPPLVISDAEVDAALGALAGAVASVGS